MHPDLESMVKLDAIDRTLRELKAKKTRFDNTLASAKARVEQRTAKRDALLERIDANQKALRENQRSTTAYEARRTSAQRVLEGGGGDPEAAQRQIVSVAEQLDKLETEALERMEQDESNADALAEINKLLAEAEDFLRAEDAGHKPGVDKIRAEYNGLLPPRKALLSELPSHVSARYDNLVSRKTRALAEIVNGSCVSCQMVVRQQHIANLDRDLLQTCGGCGRWLLPAS